ncbi:hypothetical protein NB550_21045 [Vibrio parahaemolyticus]|uniref:hypothetical protein n=1 Tax=Vibrio parahaemolyticus TaxID=670 RepID=UPI0004BA5B57|nr:hypothetical protein [Vibrio parahaemolyticus]EGQ7784187.1 hypothetical protein [Vibrio parahaemolyticus]EGR0068518.1 hypothetical protein [Vibrio parahaemolyticus]EKH9212794.1 hypothetical protein [Vibrio parahaemolyticus]MBY4653459.1 hypothetical protein [Vibrio parahaemolyticus]MCC4209586.1 hypothetical protein [Vibrio parahaemolyticus]
MSHSEHMSKPINHIPRPEVAVVDPTLEQLFNRLLRQQLAIDPQSAGLSQTDALRQACVSLVEALIHQPEAAHKNWVALFGDLADKLVTVFQQSNLTEQEQGSSYINATGLVMSVKDAIHTVKDIYRVKAFLRGLDQALQSSAFTNQENLHVVYPACGPFAPLLLPLICYYQSTNPHGPLLKITLIDIQPGAVKVLNRLIELMGIAEHVHQVFCMDVMEYHPDHSIDILIIEAMHHGLTREGHLHFLLHLRQFLSEQALLLPEQITVEAALANPQREFVEQWQDCDFSHSRFIQEGIRSERIELGEIFKINRETLNQFNEMELGSGFRLLEAGQVQIPRNIPDIHNRILLLSVKLGVFGQENVDQYDSGITHPRPEMSVCVDFRPKAAEPDDLLVKGGDKLKFYYKLCGAPGFLPTVA